MNQALVPTPAAEPMTHEPVLRATPINAENLSAARLPSSVNEEPTMFLTRSKVEARREKKKASVSLIYLDFLPYSV